MACDAQSLINTAYAAGYAKLSTRALMEAIVASACAGGGGGGGGTSDFILVPGPPTENPPVTLSHIVVDSAGRQWMYWGSPGSWH